MRRSNTTSIAATALVITALFAADLAVAQEPRDVPPPTAIAGGSAATTAPAEPEWGLTAETMVEVGSYAFRPRNSSATEHDTFWDTGYMYRSAGSDWFYAPLHLPAGALITRLGVDMYDASTTEDPSVGLFHLKADRTLGYLSWWFYPTSDGYVSPTATLSPAHTVDHTGYYVLVVDPKINGQDIRWRGMRVYYRLQISPAPPAASFTDVPTGHAAFQAVEALKSSGITLGCTATEFCPGQSVTRAQMALFLARALGLHYPE